jgi:hypothetical protein
MNKIIMDIAIHDLGNDVDITSISWENSCQSTLQLSLIGGGVNSEEY